MPINVFAMLKLIFIFLIGIAYAAQTRIKIGSQSWGYQIELNQGQNVRTEFADDEGVASGTYLYKAANNETKKLEYRIDPNRMEPDISFNIINVAATEMVNVGDSNSTNNVTSSASNSTDLTGGRIATSNMTFDSIDSKQDFRGHVTLKVSNSTYNINFVTGDKTHTREETLLPSGMMFGRFSYLLKNSPTKLVINYKFNSTSPDPTFEVSLYKTIESESSQSSSSNNNYHQPAHPQSAAQTPRESYSRQIAYPARNIADRYNAIAPVGPSSGQSTPLRAQPHYPLPEKYRDRSQSPSSQVPPSWYYNRGKPVPVYDP